MKNCLYMLRSETNKQMDSLIITTENGGVIVVDGGYTFDAPKLLSKLREITGKEKPHIDGWFLSHPHDDHICAFIEIMEKMSDQVDVDKVYYNFPSAQYCRRLDNDKAPSLFYEKMPYYADKICVVSTADKYTVAGIDFDILYTTEQSILTNTTNNSSMVFRFVLGGKSFIFLGDLGIEAGNKLLSMYGNGLKSDVCKLAHHGQNGVTEEVYKAINPSVCFWCTPDWLWNNDRGQGFNTAEWKTVEVRSWMDKLGVKENYNLVGDDVVYEI